MISNRPNKASLFWLPIAFMALNPWLVSSASAGRGCQYVSQTICVIDGDTFELSGARVRIANIDAPEIGGAKCDAEQRLGNLAKRRLQTLLSNPNIEVKAGDPKSGRTIDKYGRTLATVTVGKADVGAILVDEGLARPWRGKREPWCNK